MPEFIEKHFAQESGESKSPEQIKEEKGLELAEKIREIKEKPEKTIEDYQEIIKLVKKIEGLFEGKEFSSEKAKEMLENLKNTPLWDKEKEQWNYNINKEGELEDSNRCPDSQLLGVLAKAITGNAEKAKQMLKDLKNTPLWDKGKEQWNWHITKEGKLRYSNRYSSSQLLGVLAEAVTGNAEKAKEMLENLKNTPLWDERKEQWNWRMSKKAELEDSDRCSDFQLLGVLAEAITGNGEKAKQMLENLKNTSLWDEKKKQWNWYMRGGELKSSDRYSRSQLLGVLAEAITGDVEKAKEMLENLKKTPLWDEEKKQWNYNINEEGELESSDRYSDIQLLGVLAEAFSEKPDEFVDYFLSLSNE